MATFLALAALKPWTWGDQSTAARSASRPGPPRGHVRLCGAVGGEGHDDAAVGVVPATQPIDFDWGRAATALAGRDAWGVATLVYSGLQAHDLRAEAPPGHVELAIQTWQEVSRTTLGLDARASHGPDHPPAGGGVAEG